MSDTLKDFFISIGFKIDEASQKTAIVKAGKTQQVIVVNQDKLETEAFKKARERREKTEREVEKFGLRLGVVMAGVVAGIQATALGVVAVVDKTAKSFEGLHYAGQRIGASVRNLTAFSYGIGQLGGSTEQANASLEKFGEHLRMNPQGYEGMLKSLGVQTRNAAGQLRDSAELAAEALQALRSKPYAVARNTADSLGFDEATTRAGMDSRLLAMVAQRKAEQERIGLDPDKAGIEGSAFERSMRHLQEVAADVAKKVDANLFQKIQPLLDRLAEWLAANGGKIADVVSAIADGFVKLSVAIANNLANINYDDLFGKEGEAGNKLLPALSRVATAITNIVKGIEFLIQKFQQLSQIQISNGFGLGTKFGEAMGWLPSGLGASSGAAGTGSADQHGARVGDAAKADRRSWWQKHAPKWAGGKDAPGDNGPVPTGAHTALKDLIAKHETGTIGPGGYTTVYGHAENGGPFAPPKPITQMTIGEILAYQKRMKPLRGSSAFPVGRGQWTESTLRGLTKDMDPNTVFTPEVQERLLDRSIQGRMGQGAQGFRSEWDSFRGLSDDEINRAIQAHRDAQKVADDAQKAAPSAEKRLPPGAVTWGADSKGNPVAIDAQGRSMSRSGGPAKVGASPFGTLDPSAFKVPPLGTSPSLYNSYDNSRNRGNTTITAPQTFNIQGGDVNANLRAARLAAGRGGPDWLRNMQGAEA